LIKKVVCGQCEPNTEVEVIEEKDEEGCKTLVLKCGHKQRHFVRNLTDKVPVSDSVSSQVSHLISFETEYDRIEGVYVLIQSKTRFSGIEKNKFYLNEYQLQLLKSKNIKYKFANPN
jgi:hypothetical protein